MKSPTLYLICVLLFSSCATSTDFGSNDIEILDQYYVETEEGTSATMGALELRIQRYGVNSYGQYTEVYFDGDQTTRGFGNSGIIRYENIDIGTHEFRIYRVNYEQSTPTLGFSFNSFGLPGSTTYIGGSQKHRDNYRELVDIQPGQLLIIEISF